METNPPTTSIVNPKTDSEKITVKKTLSFKKKIRFGNLARRILKWILFLGIPLLLISFISFYFLIYLSSESILLRSIKNIKDVQSAKYSAEIDLNFSNTTGSESSRELSAESNILKVNDASSYKITGEGVLKSVEGNLISDSNFQISLNENDIAKIYLMNSSDALFIKLVEFSYSNLIDKTLSDNWIKIDNSFLDEKFEIENLFDPNQENQTGDKIKDRLFLYPPIDLADKYPSDKVRGINTYHFKYVVNKDNLKKDFGLKEGSFMDRMEFGEGNLWIGKKKNSVIRLKGSASIKDVGSEGTLLNLNYDLTFYDFGSTQIIKIPENFLDIRELLE